MSGGKTYKEDKTYKERVAEHAKDFGEIYAEFAAEFAEKKGEELWLNLFDMVFPDGEVDDLVFDHNRVFFKRDRNDAVVSTVFELGLQEERVGPVFFTDPRVEEALAVGNVTREQLRVPGHAGAALEYSQHNVVSCDPIFWRSLVEVLSRAFVASKGPRPWKLEKSIDLVFDMDEIRRSLKGGKWNKKKVLDILGTKEPYVSKYPRTAHQAGVGEDRVQEITDDIGPMNDGALNRLSLLFPQEFAKVKIQREIVKYRSRTQSTSGNEGT